MGGVKPRWSSLQSFCSGHHLCGIILSDIYDLALTHERGRLAADGGRREQNQTRAGQWDDGTMHHELWSLPAWEFFFLLLFMGIKWGNALFLKRLWLSWLIFGWLWFACVGPAEGGFDLTGKAWHIKIYYKGKKQCCPVPISPVAICGTATKNSNGLKKAFFL